MAVEPAEVFPLGDYLREELLARKLSVSNLAARTGLTPLRVSELLSPSGVALLFEIDRIARVLDVSPGLLLWLQLSWLERKRES